MPPHATALGYEFFPMLWGWKQVEQFKKLVVPGYANVVLGPNESVNATTPLLLLADRILN